MTIFGEVRLGRIGYIVMFVLMIGFDFVKWPIQHYFIAMQDQAAQALMAPRPAGREDIEAGKINGKTMPLMLKSHEDLIRSIVNSPTKLSKAEIEKRIRAVTSQPTLDFTPNYPVDPEIKQLATLRSTMAMLEPVALLIMGGITIVGMLWMVSGRLRDIGWPQPLLWALLAPVFVPRFLHLPLSPLVAEGVAMFFYTALFALALIPGEGSRRPPPPVLRTEPSRPLAAKPSGQFGKLGVR